MQRLRGATGAAELAKTVSPGQAALKMRHQWLPWESLTGLRIKAK